jgi:hypothetical protein
MRRLVIRTADGPLRPLWVFAYDAAWRAIGAYLGGECRPRGSLDAGDLRYGISDLDLEVVTDDAAGANRVRRRWARLTRLLPPLARLVDLAVYERAELEAARSASTLRSPEPLHLVPPMADEAGLRVRPGIRAGAEGPWLELQFLWRWVLGACAGAPAADRPYLCVKLVSDPARIWLWVEHGEDPPTRRAVLERALALMPEEAESIERALALDAALYRSPRADLADSLPFCVRTSARIAARTSAEAFAAGATEVALAGADPPRLALRADHRDGLRELTGSDPPLLPLADWRSRAWPQYPDDAFAATDLDPADPRALSAAVAAGGDLGPFASLWRDGLMVLAGPGILRAVQCEATDPVSFALARGDRMARFPDTPGLSAADCAARALAEHRAWLGAGGTRLADWMEAQLRTTTPDLQTFGWLLSAARAALFHASVEAGEPRLCLTMAAAAEEVGAIEEWEAYATCRHDHLDPSQAPVMELREKVLALPGFAFERAERIRA